MKTRVIKLKLSRRLINLPAFLFIGGSVLFAWQTVAEMQILDKTPTQMSEKTNESNEKPVAIHSAGRGNPYINFKDGRDLKLPDGINGDKSQPQVLASADFDADGVADLAVADSNGALRLFKSSYKARKGEEKTERGGDESEPFEPTGKSVALNISPDFLVAGDFNADGRADLLAAAKGASGVSLLSGDGQGNFSAPQNIAVTGEISALTAGEIGRRDGQADLAVAVTNKNGAFLAVFEHPESAFKHKPEIFKLPAPATDLAIGNLDADFYADIAVASGNQLTIVHGRGQAYPWDLIPDSGIERPKAFVATRSMPFPIAALAAGRFGAKRGETLALLGADGNLYRLEPDRREAPSNNRLAPETAARAKRNLLLPGDVEERPLAFLTDPSMTPEEAEKQGRPLVDASEIKGGKLPEILRNSRREAAEKFKKMHRAELDRMLAEGLEKKREYKERARAGFLRSISGKPSTLPRWTIETLTANSELTGAAVSNAVGKMMSVNVSSSNLDDILIVDPAGSRIQLVSRHLAGTDQSSEGMTRESQPTGNETAKITALDVEGGIRAVLPMRLNVDALSDLIVLRNGAPLPSVVMTAPANIFLVTSDNEDGDCQGANPCSLRNAIIRANQTPGVDSIFFSIGSATIAPTSQFPIITEGVTISGQRDGNGHPLVEIAGTNLSGLAVDGLKIRASNTVIAGLAVNQFTSLYDPDTGSSFGGNGITIESTTLSPNNGNDFIAGNYLGTDKTGSLDKGNGAAGLNIFDADDNQISNNLISGNGSPQMNGVGIAVTAGNNNIFHGNIIGLNSLGTGKLGNTRGIFLTGANNDFGGDQAGLGNTVSGNGEPYPNPSTACYGEGISLPVLINLDTFELLTLNNNIKGNRLGTNPAGTIGLGNCWKALSTGPLTQTIVGSITQTGRNIISDNGLDGIHCSEFVAILGAASEGGFCAISGNNIGTDITGSVSIPNDWRNSLSGFVVPSGAVEIQNNFSFSNLGAPGGTTPNGACTGFCNLISGNGTGFWAAGAFGYGTVAVFNNFIGLNQNGDQALPNATLGLATNNTIGETYIGLSVPNLSLGNVVSANSYTNIDTATGGGEGGLFQTAFIHGNFIGTDSSGTFSVAPEPSGENHGTRGIIALSHFGDTVFIGAGNTAARNVIAGNKGTLFGAGAGIEIFGSTGSIKILNNLIGLNRSLQPLGNQGGGIRLTGHYDINDVQIGGTDEEANQIAYNGTNGRNFAGVMINNAAQGITVRNNSIHDNIGLGIDLNFNGTFYEGDGITPNDVCSFDSDTGANDLQNYPELFTPVQNGDGTLTIDGFLLSQMEKPYRIDFYSSPGAAPSNYGEGANYLGSVDVTTDVAGLAEFVFTTPEPVSASFAITATATDFQGSVSEFSCAAGLCTGSARTVAEYREKFDGDEMCGFEEIVVNRTGDQEDQNPTDNYCDIDTSNPDPRECTLRAALQVAAQRKGHNTIKFNIEGAGAGVIEITPQSPLPVITESVSILGNTQAFYTDKPKITIVGSPAAGAYGLQIAGEGKSTIRALAINSFLTAGINLSGGESNKIEGCFIGLDPSGEPSTVTPRQPIGINIVNSRDNTVGSLAASGGNVVSNNETGILIQGSSAGNVVLNNKIGTDFTGDLEISNFDGIVLQGASGNTIGDKFTGAHGNLIAGNERGVVLKDNSKENQILANDIGVKNLDNILGNKFAGVVIESGSGRNIIGGEGNFGNVIGGSTEGENPAGIFVRENAAGENQIIGNKIGVTADLDPLPNTTGIILAAGRTIIGRNAVPNYIGANTGAGIRVIAPAGGAIEGSILSNRIGFLDDVAFRPNQIGIDLQGDAKHGNAGVFKIESNTLSYNTQTGIRIDGDNYVVGGAQGGRGNLINNSVTGIEILTGGAQNTVEQNFIGTDPGGVIAAGNQYGIDMMGYKNQIRSNLISGNTTAGIRIRRGADDEEMQKNDVSENTIGLDSSGFFSLANRTGVILTHSAQDNHLDQNTISGNTEEGIRIGRIGDEQVPNPAHNRITRNLIGINETRVISMPNKHGIVLSGGAVNNLIGNGNFGNTISGNTQNGIYLAKYPEEGDDTVPITGNIIVRNLIGVSQTDEGIVQMPNNNGVFISNGAVDNTIGGHLAFPSQNHDGNVISGNHEYGIKICYGNPVAEDPCRSGDFGFMRPSANKIHGNVIGLAGFTPPLVGDGAMPNNAGGIFITESDANRIGDHGPDSAGFGNVICKNGGNGITIKGDFDAGGFPARNNVIIKNFIGVRPGRIPGGNSGHGIEIKHAPGTYVGYNVFGGNQSFAAKVYGNDIFPRPGNLPVAGLGETLPITFEGNLIGVIRDETGGMENVGNGQGGILLENISAVAVGVDDPAPGSKNIIAANNGAGISITGEQSADNKIFNSIIFGNTGLGIDLGAAGHTPNDAGDADAGANNLQNYPVVTNQTIDGAGDLIVSYKIDSAPGNSDYGSEGLRIEFFKADGTGEGERFLNFNYYTVGDYNSLAPGVKTVNLGNAAALGFGANDKVTATATDATGNTSEFFPPVFAPTAANVTVGGQVSTTLGQGVANVRVTLTDGNGVSRSALTNNFGRYRFENVAVGQIYVVGAASRKYRFEPPSQVVQIDDARDDLNFTAAP
jgi:hypothetical protein